MTKKPAYIIYNNKGQSQTGARCIDCLAETLREIPLDRHENISRYFSYEEPYNERQNFCEECGIEIDNFGGEKNEGTK